jgi:polyisoprenoid-binding protein YceI
MRAGLLALSLLLSACSVVRGASDAVIGPEAAAAAQEPYPVAVDLPAGTYSLDPRHASVLFRIRHMELAWYTARFDSIDATLSLDPNDPSRSHLSASVGADSVSTGLLNAQNERAFDRQIGRALGMERAQRISFVSTAIARTGRYTARVAGNLSMNGQTHPATLDMTFDGGRVDPLRGGKMALGFSARGTIARSDWGVTQWAPFIGDAVQIVVEAEFTKDDAPSTNAPP